MGYMTPNNILKTPPNTPKTPPEAPPKKLEIANKPVSKEVRKASANPGRKPDQKSRGGQGGAVFLPPTV